ELRDDVVVEVRWEILHALVVGVPRALGIEDDDRRVALAREPEGEAGHVDTGWRKRGRGDGYAVLRRERRAAIDRLHLERVPHHRDPKVVRLHARVVD